MPFQWGWRKDVGGEEEAATRSPNDADLADDDDASVATEQLPASPRVEEQLDASVRVIDTDPTHTKCALSS
jgi:hypothetical protein